MRWILYVVAAIALLRAWSALVAPCCRRSTPRPAGRVAAPPDRLYTLLTEIKFGDVPMRFERQEPPSLLVARVDGNDLPFGGTWTYRIAPAPGGSELTITEDGEVYNVIFRFMSRFVFGHYATMDAYIENLQRHVEVKK